MSTFYELWGSTTPHEAYNRVQKDCVKYSHAPRNFEEFALSTVGKTIYHEIFEGYTKKQWNRKPSEISADVIKRIPVRYTWDDNYYDDCYQGVPLIGYTKMIENMLSRVDVEESTDFFEHKEQLESIAKFGIVYTGPLDELFDTSLGVLEYRSLVFEKSVVEERDFQGNAIMNYADVSVPWTRIIEHRHFTKFDIDQKIPFATVTKEYPSFYGDDQSVEPYYPIPDEKNRLLSRRYKDLASMKEHSRYILGGRLGTYQYLDMHVAVRQAIDLANELTMRSK